MSDAAAPSSILIIGAGVFGLSTALSLLKRPHYAASKITILDASETLPNPSGSSVDASRIVRADYSNQVYSRLAAQAQLLWRDTTDGGWGGEGRYYEPGFVLTVDSEGEKVGYVKKSMRNAVARAEESKKDAGGKLRTVEVLETEDDNKRVTGYKHASGKSGYVNWNSGWADAEKCVAYALRRLRQEGGERMQIMSGARVERLLVESGKCVGTQLQGGEQIRAELTILAAGAWSPSLVNLQGRCLATGQTLCYIAISEQEQQEMQDRPTIINMTRGTFIIPPRGHELKVARHGYGYRNPHSILGEQLVNGNPREQYEVSVPRVGIHVPKEGQEACRAALRELLPEMGDRPFTNTRICWYCDTPDGDFLIDYHPDVAGLFLATGGSGHGFKFFPIIGAKIADAVEGTLQPDLKESWQWKAAAAPDFVGCDDGSRAGPRGMLLNNELKRKSRL